MSKAERLESVLRTAVESRVFPGAVYAVGRSSGICQTGAIGTECYEARHPVSTDTIYDLASLTKVAVTTPLLMRLVEKKQVALDGPACEYVTEFPLVDVTVRQLLVHASGWPAYCKFFLECQTRDELLDALWSTAPQTEPGRRCVYSDLGFIALGVLIERVANQSIDHFAAREIFEPLDMTETRFNPPKKIHDRIAPTENDPWRKRLLRGEVHDENAFVLGGVAGHAGLFGTVGDLSRLAQLFLRGGQPLFAANTVKQFTRRADVTIESCSRALGWDTPAPGSSCGTRVSRRAFGHTGYAGTSIWIDPELDWFAILLTNRVHPTRRGPDITPVRIAFNEAAVDLLS